MFSLLVILFFAAVSGSRVFPEYRRQLDLPAGWKVKFTKNQPQHSLVVLLKQKNVNELETFFTQVSDPRKELYGQYKSLSQIKEMVAPAKKDVKAVTRWLKKYGFEGFRLSKSGDVLHCKATAAQINSAFHTDMQLWRNDKMNREIWRALAPYSLPKHVADKIDIVSGIHHFPKEVKPKFVNSLSNYPIGPTDLRTRYNVTDFASGNDNNTQAVAEFQGQYYSPDDLNTFFEKFVPGNKNSSVAGVVGPNSPQEPGIEASLDIQYIMGVNPDTATYFYEQASFEFFSDLMQWIALLNNDEKPPLVHSVSYGLQKEKATSGSYKDRFETEMQKLAARGITIIFASGDDGAGCAGGNCVRFEPSFPASSPSVTAVGATTFLSGPPVTPDTPESAVTAFGSGGGFSWYYKRQPWQEEAVSHYVEAHTGNIPSNFQWNKNGRGTPDVAALGWDFQVVQGGGVTSVGGTSASAPTFAAIVSLLNDQQLKAGKPPLGFLNPWIYQTAKNVPDAFYDVTVGSNPDQCCAGYSCSEGWDSVTGNGTPNYKVLKEHLP